jgi:phosphoglucomutase
MIAECAAWAAEKGKSLYGLLPEIYKEYGFYKERLASFTRKGKEGAVEISKMMENYRTAPPKMINNSIVVMIKDYLKQKTFHIEKNIEEPITLPKSDVLQFYLKDGSKISVRPSGTEPKIKFYFSVREDFRDITKFDEMNTFLDKRIDAIVKDLGL